MLERNEKILSCTVYLKRKNEKWVGIKTENIHKSIIQNFYMKNEGVR